MKKYVVAWEDDIFAICRTRADAEEMILSIAEENVYKNWCIDNCSDIWCEKRPYQTPAEYISKNGENCQEFSAWAWALYSFSSAYWIDEVAELE